MSKAHAITYSNTGYKSGKIKLHGILLLCALLTSAAGKTYSILIHDYESLNDTKLISSN